MFDLDRQAAQKSRLLAGRSLEAARARKPRVIAGEKLPPATDRDAVRRKRNPRDHGVSQSVDEACLPIATVILGIVFGDDIRELRRADPADTFERGHLVGMRRAGRVDESLFVDDIPSP